MHITIAHISETQARCMSPFASVYDDFSCFGMHRCRQEVYGSQTLAKSAKSFTLLLNVKLLGFQYFNNYFKTDEHLNAIMACVYMSTGIMPSNVNEIFHDTLALIFKVKIKCHCFAN